MFMYINQKRRVTCHFIDNSSLVVDLHILALTVLVVIKSDSSLDNSRNLEIAEKHRYGAVVDGDVVVRMNFDRDSLVLG